MPRPSRRVADANQQVRDLRNEIFKIDQEKVLPLRTRIAELERDNASLNKKVQDLELMHGLYKRAWEGAAGLIHAIASGKP